MELGIFEQLEEKVRAAAHERSSLLKNNEKLQQKISKQAKEVKQLRGKISENGSIEKEVRERIDRLIEFLESLPIL
jgi:predicted RNase H-like nuclease (RuvC/YqgF family)